MISSRKVTVSLFLKLHYIFIIFFSYSISYAKQNQAGSDENQYLSEIEIYQRTDEIQKKVMAGDFEIALIKINNVLDSINPEITSTYLPYLYFYKANIYYKRGNFFLAEATNNLASKYCIKLNNQELFSSTINLSGVLKILSNDIAGAKRIFKEVIPKINFPLGIDKNELILGNLAAIAFREKDTLECTRILKEFENAGIFNPSTSLIRVIGLCTGIVYGYEEALPYLKKAFWESQVNTDEEVYQKAISQYFYAICLKELRNITEAVEQFDKILIQLVDHSSTDITPSLIASTQYESIVIDCLIQLSEIYRTGYQNLIRSLQYARNACNRAIFLSHLITTESDRFIIAEKAYKAFNIAIICSLELYETTNDRTYLDEALSWSLISKSLSQNLTYEREISYNKIAFKLNPMDSLKVLRKRLLEIDLMDQSKNFGDFNIRNYKNILRNIESIEAEIKNHYPDIKTEIASTSLVQQLNKSLYKDELYLGLHELDSVIVCFTVKNGVVGVRQILKTNEFVRKVSYIKEQITTSPSSLYTEYDLKVLYDSLNIVSNELVGQEYFDQKRIAVHYNGMLMELPIEIFLSNISWNQDKIVQEGFSHNPIVRYLVASQINGNNWNVSFFNRLYLVYCLNNQTIIKSSLEKSKIRKYILNVNFLELENLDRRIVSIIKNGNLHISSHLAINPNDPYQSILFCDEIQNGISLNRLNYELFKNKRVYLNTCESGYGHLNKGEGLLSLGFIFALAGSKTIIQNLWEASDQSAAMIAEYYYKHLRFNSPEKALMKAKIEYLRNCPPGMDHPYYWAGVVCYTQKEVRINSWIAILSIVIFAFLIVIGYISLRKRIFR